MQQRKSKKILIYFFLLIIVGSINNITLNQKKFEKVKHINILGLKNIDKEIILKEIKSLNLENIFFLNVNEIRKKIDSNTLVESYKIFKKYPSTLQISIKETNFLAKINQKGKIYIVGSNGKFIKNNYSTNQLPYIFGKPEIKEFLRFKKIIDKSKVSYQKIKSLYFYQSNRWDIELEGDIIIKLSKNLTAKSLDDIIVFLNDENFKNIKTIDARVENQIIIND